MECIVLGNGGMMPTPQRMTTSVLVRHEGRMLLFDAGEGIQISIKRGGFGICGLDAIAVSHLHADHVLGLPGILMFRAQCQEAGPLTIFGPPGIEQFIRHTIEDLHYYLNYEISFIECAAPSLEPLGSWNGQFLYAAALDHSTFCLGYRLEEAVRPGKFDPQRALALGISPGPQYGKLQCGNPVVRADGRIIQPSEVLGPPRRGRSMAYVTDTRPCAGLERLCMGVDLAFVEGMFALEHAADAEQKRHMTTSEAAAAAKRARAARLVLLHFSPRYLLRDEEILLREANTQFEGAELGRELQIYEVPLPDE